MSVNRAELDMKDRLVRQVAYLTREIQALKTRQLLGGDNIVVEGITLAEASETLEAGAKSTWRIKFTPAKPELALAELAYTTFVDNDNDLDYHFPLGASLTADQKLLFRDLQFDWALSFDVDGRKDYVLQVENTGSNSKTLYHKFKFYTIKRPAAGSS